MGVSDSLYKHGTGNNNLTSSFGTKNKNSCLYPLYFFHGHGQ